MNVLKKPHRIKLSPVEYRDLCRRIMERDGYRCQKCGSMTNLSVDHKKKRSQLGDDSEENLWSLCWQCHRVKDEYVDEIKAKRSPTLDSK
jgi:5-methylcytosine-specific restriction endonuclease McrA